MVTAVKTSTVSTATQAFNGRRLDVQQDGTRWEFAQDTASSLTPRYSKDGATWTTATALAGLRNASVFIDLDDCAHVAWKQAGSTGPNGASLVDGWLYYMRGTPNAARTSWTWSAPVLVTDTVGNSGSPGVDYPDVVAHRQGTGWVAHIVASYVFSTGNLALYAGITINADRSLGPRLGVNGDTSYGGMGDLGGTYQNGRATQPSIDFNHTGDGKTVAGGTPHLYVGWTAGTTGTGKGVRFRKAVFVAGAWTFSAEREIDPNVNNRTLDEWLLTVFDGTRVVIAGQLFSSTGTSDRFFVLERDAADTTTVSRTLIAPSGVGAEYLYRGSFSYDRAGNLYLFGRDATGADGTRKLNWRKWTRATATLGPISTLDVTGSDTPYVSAKRCSQPGNAIEVVYTDGTAAPFVVQYDRTVPDVDAPATPYVPVLML